MHRIEKPPGISYQWYFVYKISQEKWLSDLEKLKFQLIQNTCLNFAFSNSYQSAISLQ